MRKLKLDASDKDDILRDRAYIVTLEKINKWLDICFKKNWDFINEIVIEFLDVILEGGYYRVVLGLSMAMKNSEKVQKWKKLQL